MANLSPSECPRQVFIQYGQRDNCDYRPGNQAVNHQGTQGKHALHHRNIFGQVITNFMISHVLVSVLPLPELLSPNISKNPAATYTTNIITNMKAIISMISPFLTTI
jgi:hypothetical protein